MKKTYLKIKKENIDEMLTGAVPVNLKFDSSPFLKIFVEDCGYGPCYEVYMLDMENPNNALRQRFDEIQKRATKDRTPAKS